MKITFWDRLVLFLGGLLTVAAGFFLAVVGLQFLGAIGEALPLWARTVCIVCGALTVAFGVYVIAFPFRRPRRRQEFVTQKTDNGELRIAVDAVENLVRRCIDLHDEIRLESMEVLNARSGVSVDLNIALANNISIPLAVASLQKQIKQYLAASSGIEIREVRVSVEATVDDLEPHSAAAAESAVQPEEASAPAPKRPLHQRLFGRMDQPEEDGETEKDPLPPVREDPADETPDPEADRTEAPFAPPDPETEEPASEPVSADEAACTEPDEEVEDDKHE